MRYKSQIPFLFLLLFIVFSCSKDDQPSNPGSGSGPSFRLEKTSFLHQEIIYAITEAQQESPDSMAGSIGGTSLFFYRLNDTCYYSQVPQENPYGSQDVIILGSPTIRPILIDSSSTPLDDQLFNQFLSRLDTGLSRLIRYSFATPLEWDALSQKITTVSSSYLQLSPENKRLVQQYLLANTLIMDKADASADLLWQVLVPELNSPFYCGSADNPQDRLACVSGPVSTSTSRLEKSLPVIIESKRWYSALTTLRDMADIYAELNLLNSRVAWEKLMGLELIVTGLSYNPSNELDSIMEGIAETLAFELDVRALIDDDKVSSQSMIATISFDRIRMNDFWSKYGQNQTQKGFPPFQTISNLFQLVDPSGLEVEITSEQNMSGLVSLGGTNTQITINSSDIKEREASFRVNLNSEPWFINGTEHNFLFNPGEGPCFFKATIPLASYTNTGVPGSCGASPVVKTMNLTNLIVDLKYEENASAALGYVMEGSVYFEGVEFIDYNDNAFLFSFSVIDEQFNFEQYNFNQGGFPDPQNPFFILTYEEGCGIKLALNSLGVFPVITGYYVFPNTEMQFADCGN